MTEALLDVRGCGRATGGSTSCATPTSSVREGGRPASLGPNGAGKSSLAARRRGPGADAAGLRDAARLSTSPGSTW